MCGYIALFSYDHRHRDADVLRKGHYYAPRLHCARQGTCTLLEYVRTYINRCAQQSIISLCMPTICSPAYRPSVCLMRPSPLHWPYPLIEERQNFALSMYPKTLWWRNTPISLLGTKNLLYPSHFLVPMFASVPVVTQCQTIQRFGA